MAMPYPAYTPSRPPPSTDSFSSNSYPPNGPYNPSNSSYNKGHDDLRPIARTPSPTPSEAQALSDGLFSWKQLSNWRFWIRKEWIKYYIILSVILVITALISIYHHQIVTWLTPVTKWLHSLKFGWLVPIGVLFVISFPPLFGHEIVAILCGLVWGLWIGFGIVCAGTFIGEVGNFYAFKYCCRARGEKMERTQIPYACLARCVRTGGFRIALIARFSAIPGHFTTAVFATCGMNIFVFSIAAILSLPKQFITVYLGVILEQSDNGTVPLKSRLINYGVLSLTFGITILAMWYIFHQMALVKPAVIYDRRKARQAKMAAAGGSYQVDLYANPALNDSDSSVHEDIPLTAKTGTGSSAIGPMGESLHPRYDYEQQQKQRQYAEWAAQREREQQQQWGDGRAHEHQQWDHQGRAVGYTPGPVHQVLYAPQPQAPQHRSPIQPGAYMAAYGNPQRAQTGDEVGWDTGVQMRERAPQPQTQYTSPPPQQLQSPSQKPQTPTQAQYASYPGSSNAGGPTSAPLPTPPYHQEPQPQEPRSPFDDPEPDSLHPGYAHGGGHSIEPTGMSYHTAYGSEGSDPGAGAPPPSYR